MSYVNAKPIAQGEITFFAVTPDHFTDEGKPAPVKNGAYVVAHSESGNDHVIDCARATVTVISDSAGMTILRAIVTDPDGAVVRNLSATGHADLLLAPGIYEARISRELGLDDMIRNSAD